LKSDIGQSLIASKKYGAVIQEVEPEHLAEIPIPNPPDETKQRINNLIERSFDLRDQSNELLDKATELLKSALNLPPIYKIKTKQFDKTVNVNNYSVALSELAGRIDGSYHVPIVDAIVKHLKINAAEVTTVGDNRISKEIILPGRFKRIYVEEGQGRVFFGGKQIYELDPSNKKFLSSAMHSKRITKELEISENTILITRSGTLGKVNIAPKHWEHWIASDHIIRVLPKNDDIAGYLYVFLSSEYGKELINRFAYGSVVDEIDANHVSKIPFPLLKNDQEQAEINRFALQANELRYEAYRLEQEAMKIMDEEVIFAKRGD
jgi:type I restriction enzyme S subunit